MTTVTKIVMNVPVDGSLYRDKIELTKFDSVVPKRNEFLQTKHNENLLEYGIIRPFPLWVTKDESGCVRYYLMTDHSDFRFAVENNLPFQVVLKDFLNENMVIKFIVENNIFSDNLTRFQKGKMVLTYKKILIPQGKENMSKGGKGEKVTEKKHTLKILSSWINCSHETLNRIDFILKNCKNKTKLRKVEYNELTISEVYFEVKEKRKKKNYFPDLQNKLDSMGLKSNHSNSEDKPESENTLEKPVYFIDEKDKYPVVYVNTQFNGLHIMNIKRYLENLKNMNIKDVSFKKWCTLFIQTSPMFLSDTLEIIKSWGFNCVDTQMVNFNSETYKSKYSGQYHEVLLICEKNNVGIHSMKIKNHIDQVSISSDMVLDVIDSMFTDGLNKLGVFVENRDGWDTFEFIKETKELVKFHKRTG
jgi:hypothetical protein